MKRIRPLFAASVILARFNVAVSRAEAVAVVVASPKLLDENPSGPKHVKALNPFAALMERAEVHE